MSPSKLKIDDYIETVDNAAGKNVVLSELQLTRATLGSEQDHVITFLNNDLENTPDYKLKITGEGLFISLDGGETYAHITDSGDGESNHVWGIRPADDFMHYIGISLTDYQEVAE